MSILPKLFSIYRNAGYEPMTGYNPYYFNGVADAPFTKFIHGNTIHGIAGLALQEVMTLDGLAEYCQPRNILVIGNAHGWSTIALALIFPDAKVVAVDPGAEGNAFTNALAATHGLAVTAVDGYSPQDLPAIGAEHLPGPADLVLIDALHTNEAVLRDFAGCRPLAHDGTLWIFHDVINCGLVDAVQLIRMQHRLSGLFLTRTPSGMATLWKTAPQGLIDYLSVFADNPDTLRTYRATMLGTTDAVGGILARL